MAKITVIKTGETELLAETSPGEVSLGDVFRCGCLLTRLLSENEVYWVGPEACSALWPPHQNLRLISPHSSLPLSDLTINLERSPQWFQRLRGRERIAGFRPVGEGNWSVLPSARGIFEILNDPKAKRTSRLTCNHWLFSLCGMVWRNEKYYGYAANINERKAPVAGFNTRVGPRWPAKKWSDAAWRELERLLRRRGWRVSWQPSGSLEEYRDWIRGLNVMVSCDSLGLHLALAAGVPVVGLFGPTWPGEIPTWGRGLWLSCGRTMNHSPSRVADAVLRLRRRSAGGRSNNSREEYDLWPN